jgi:cytochrome c oxidase subunit 2
VRKPVFRKPRRWLLAVTTSVLAAIFLSACGGQGNILDTYGPIAGQERTLFYIILAIATVVFVGVEGALVYSIIRFRERPGMPNPRQIHGNLTIEMIWTAVPAIILFITLGFTIQTLFAVDAAPASGSMVTVEAVGHQWWWEFYYPEYKITTADSLYIPVNTNIKVELYSNNVIHSFWVPQLTGKTDVIPGHNNVKYFSANQTGTYIGECAEYCGTEHANMKFNVVVVQPDQFNTWVTTQQQAAVTPAKGSLAAQGEQIFANGVCSGCHGIVGVNIQPGAAGSPYGYYDPSVYCNDPNTLDTTKCKIGPNLTHFGSRSLIAGGVLTNNAADCQPETETFQQLLRTCNLAKWLNDPQGIKPGNDMVINQLTPDQIKALVAYLESLK